MVEQQLARKRGMGIDERLDLLTRQQVGTYDFASGAEQMQAIHWALIVYFGAPDWLDRRRKALPGAG